MDPVSLPPSEAREITRVLPQPYLLLEAAAPGFTVEEVSDVLVERTQMQRSDLVGGSFFDIVSPNAESNSVQDADGIRALLDDVVRHGKPCELGPLRVRGRHSDLSASVFEAEFHVSNCVPLLGENGQVERLLIHLEDVTELHREIEEALQSRYHRLFMQAPVGIALLEGEDFVCTLINDADLELFENRDILGHSIIDVFDEQELDPFLSELRQVYRTGEPIIRKEVPFQLREQDEEHFKTYAYLPFPNACGDIVGVAHFGYDVTELVRARQQAEHLAEEAHERNRRKDEFLATLGHELRNPLASIAYAVSSVDQTAGSFDLQQVEWACDLVGRKAEQLTDIVDELLDLTRITEGRVELDRRQVALGDVVADAVDSVRPAIDSRRQNLTVNLPKPVIVEVDGARMTQVLSNLLSNASKYAGDPGEITLTGGVDGEWLELEVVDNGRGIEADALPHIFEPFYQSDVTLDRSGSGLGIGLSLVRRLVQLHGGEVEARSDGRDRGSQFSVRMPVVIEQQMGVSRGKRNDGEDLFPLRVLIVDDDVDVAESLCRLLERKVEEIDACPDGQEALERVESYRPDIVLLDIGLPRMDGYEVARRLRQQPDGDKIYLAALTGYGQRSDHRATEAAGFDRHIVKPASPDELTEVFREALQRQ